MKDVPGLSAAFAHVLSKRRNALGFSQDKFAELAGMERTYVSMLERGIHAPSLRAIVLIGEVFNLKASELVQEVEEVQAAGVALPEPLPRDHKRKKPNNA